MKLNAHEVYEKLLNEDRILELKGQIKFFLGDVDYLIFGYDMGDDGVVTIKDVWLKKVWEITRPMEDWSVNLQVKLRIFMTKNLTFLDGLTLKTNIE